MPDAYRRLTRTIDGLFGPPTYFVRPEGLTAPLTATVTAETYPSSIPRRQGKLAGEMNAKLREADSAETTPLTEREARFVRSKLAKTVGVFANRLGYAHEIEAVTDYTPAMRNLSGFVEKNFGGGVAFYRSVDPRGHSGFYLRQQPSVIFVNIDSPDPIMQTIGQELVHSMSH